MKNNHDIQSDILYDLLGHDIVSNPIYREAKDQVDANWKDILRINPKRLIKKTIQSMNPEEREVYSRYQSAISVCYELKRSGIQWESKVDKERPFEDRTAPTIINVLTRFGTIRSQIQGEVRKKLDDKYHENKHSTSPKHKFYRTAIDSLKNWEKTEIGIDDSNPHPYANAHDALNRYLFETLQLLLEKNNDIEKITYARYFVTKRSEKNKASIKIWGDFVSVWLNVILLIKHSDSYFYSTKPINENEVLAQISPEYQKYSVSIDFHAFDLLTDRPKNILTHIEKFLPEICSKASSKRESAQFKKILMDWYFCMYKVYHETKHNEAHLINQRQYNLDYTKMCSAIRSSKKHLLKFDSIVYSTIEMAKNDFKTSVTSGSDTVKASEDLLMSFSNKTTNAEIKMVEDLATQTKSNMPKTREEKQKFVENFNQMLSILNLSIQTDDMRLWRLIVRPGASGYGYIQLVGRSKIKGTRGFKKTPIKVVRLTPEVIELQNQLSLNQ